MNLLLVDLGNTRVKWAAAGASAKLRLAGERPTTQLTATWIRTLAAKHAGLSQSRRTRRGPHRRRRRGARRRPLSRHHHRLRNRDCLHRARRKGPALRRRDCTGPASPARCPSRRDSAIALDDSSHAAKCAGQINPRRDPFWCDAQFPGRPQRSCRASPRLLASRQKATPHPDGWKRQTCSAGVRRLGYGAPFTRLRRSAHHRQQGLESGE